MDRMMVFNARLWTLRCWLGLVIMLVLVGCAEKNAGSTGPGGDDYKPKPPAPETVQELNSIRNYLIKAASEAGEAPADLDAAKAAYKKASTLNWPSTDAWGFAYVYEKGMGTDFKVYSLGPDGKSGTEDDVFPSEDINKSVRD